MESKKEDQRKKRKSNWNVSYSSATQRFAEERLNVRFTDLGNSAVRIRKLLDLSNIKHITHEIKDKVYERIIELIETEDYPQGGIEPFKEASVTDIVGTILICFLAFFRRKNKVFSLKLRREKEIVAPDGETGGSEEYVMIDTISVTNDKIVLVVEAKRDNMDKCLIQCLLAMKDAYDCNKELNNYNTIYGFTTEGIHWRLVIYDGKSFRLSDEIKVMAPDMATDKDSWIAECSVIVDVLYYVLTHI
jgi:hypothetical protein